MAFTVSALSIHHAPLCAELDAHCFSSNNFSEDVINALLQQHNTHGFLAQIDDEPIGYAIFGAACDMADLLTICILPQHQGNGYGRMFLSHIISEAKHVGVKTIFLEVRKSNTAAIALYKRLGGTRIGERPNYYTADDGTAEDAYVFQIPTK